MRRAWRRGTGLADTSSSGSTDTAPDISFARMPQDSRACSVAKGLISPFEAVQIVSLTACARPTADRVSKSLRSNLLTAYAGGAQPAVEGMRMATTTAVPVGQDEATTPAELVRDFANTIDVEDDVDLGLAGRPHPVATRT